MATMIDLTYPLSPETVMYPGLPQPEFTPHFTVDEQGANVTRVSFVSHVGTHIDAPSHVQNGGQSLDELPLERLICTAAVVDVTDRPHPAIITRTDLQAFDTLLRPGDIALVVTGIYREYGTPAYNDNCPALDPDAAQWLVQKQIAAYATDATSIEQPGSSGNPVHKVVLGAGIPIIENLANLDALAASRVQLIALPIKLKALDGGPCRVVALQ